MRPDPPRLAKGDRVCWRYEPDKLGKIVELGPEVSEIRFDDKTQRYIRNEHIKVIKS